MSNATQLERQLHELFNCDTWLLAGETAIAISFPEIRVDRGIPFDVPQFEELTMPLFDFLNNFLVQDCDELNLNIPGSRFWVKAILEPKETEKRHCMYISSELASLDACTVRIYSTRQMEDQVAESVRNFVGKWFENSRSIPVHNEVIKCDPIECQRYKIDPTEGSYPQDGFEFEIRPYSPVTWPWLELYLAIRRSFPKRQRLSIEFR